MEPRSNRLAQFGVGLTALTLIGSLVLWSELPPEVAVHFSTAGSAGSYVPKPVGVLLVPATMIATLVVVRQAARFDPPDDDRAFVAGVVGTMLFLAAIQFLVLGWNLGYQVSFPAVFGGTIVWFGALIGYAVWRTGSITNT